MKIDKTAQKLVQNSISEIGGGEGGPKGFVENRTIF
jgi:hypothetical protein